MSEAKPEPSREVTIRAALALLRSPLACMFKENRDQVVAAIEKHGITVKELLEYISDLSRY